MRDVAAHDECDRDDMVCEHLEVVFPALFHVKHDQLVYPTRELAQIVKLDWAGNEPNRVIDPKVLSLEQETREVDINALSEKVSKKWKCSRLGKICMYHAKRPKDRIVGQTPALFGEPYDLALAQLGVSRFFRLCPGLDGFGGFTGG
jgi:hypothetical protein